MHRTQLYFDEAAFEQIKHRARAQGVSVSAYIRDLVQRDLALESVGDKACDLSDYSGLWKDREISQETLRKKAWK